MTQSDVRRRAGRSLVRIVVTGGSGKAGRWAVRALRGAGHDVLNVDVAHDGSPHGQCVLADLTDLGQCHEVVAGADAVVHLAAIPAPEIKPAGETFRNNALSTYNVFASAVERGVGRIVWASSETVLGLPFDEPPAFAPIDETHPPRPETSYALSKLAGETMAEQFARRTGVPFVGLRISNIMEPQDYARFESWQDDARLRKWNLWGYIDVRDVAQAVERSLSADVTGATVAIVAAADTCMRRPSAELMAEVYPGVELRRPLEGRETLLAIDHAREVLGYEPAYSWVEASAGSADAS
jgi:nucleoside-diphosphate-sugar epimerase